MPTPDPIVALVNHALGVRYEDLPSHVVAAVKKAIIDTLGAGIAGSSAQPGRIVAAMAREHGGRHDSTLWVYGDRLPASEAAFANAIMARCRELDDVHEGSPRIGRGHGGHVNVAIVPAALAVLERLPWPVGGRELIAAIAVGGDILVRLRLAAGDAGRVGWEGPTVAPFGVAATVGRLHHLEQDTLLNAMGAAYAHCSGNVLSTSDGTWDVWLNAGMGARAGVVAVDLARRGHQGARAPLLGAAGLYPLYFRGEYHADALLSGLGTDFESGAVSIKPYASCKATHHAIHTTLALMRRHHIEHRAIARIVVHTSDYNMQLAGLNEHGEPKYAPRTINEAQFSIPFTMALAMMQGAVLPDTLSDAALADAETLDLSRRITLTVTDAKNELAKREGYPPVDIDIHLIDGTVRSGCELYVKGHPRNPMTVEEVMEKFMRCAELAAMPLPAGSLRAICSCAADLETLEDTRAIPRWLVATGHPAIGRG
ncbi:MAG TPA: MmgE/PrpD family protein [Acetobacteraceae bacterium]|nr:MmgE/PrpD family protein [Acetobacteraceae bacterium]